MQIITQYSWQYVISVIKHSPGLKLFVTKKIGYDIDVLRQTGCLVVNPIKVNSFAYLFDCTIVGRASD